MKLLDKTIVVNMFVQLFSWICISVCVAGGESPCYANPYSIECLPNQINYLYANNYDELWDHLHLYADKIKEKTKDANVHKFLNITKNIGNNIELLEFFHDVVENYVVQNQDSCFEILYNMDPETKKVIFGILRNPIIRSKDEIDRVFQKMQRNEKYKNFSNDYWKKSEEH